DREIYSDEVRPGRARGAERAHRELRRGAKVFGRGIVGVDDAEARRLAAVQGLRRTSDGAEEVGLVRPVPLPGPMELEVLPRDVHHHADVELDVPEAVGARRQTVGGRLE